MKPFQRGLFTNLVNESIKTIDKPINLSQSIEAEKIGLILLSRSSDPNYNLYKHNSCGHTDFYQPTHVRRNNITCKTCLLLRNTNDAYSKGFQLVHKSENTYYKYIRSCGHVVKLTPQAVLHSKDVNCKLCFEEELKRHCELNGYLYIVNDVKGNGSYRLIGFKNCNHTKQVHHSQIIKGNIICRECEDDNRKYLTSLIGLHELSHEFDRYFKYQLPCGHHKVLRADHAVDGSYLCDTCGNSHYQKPSKLYIYKFNNRGFSWLKLGFAKNVEIRKMNYGLIDGTSSELLFCIDFDKGRDAMIVEKNVHRLLKQYRIEKKFMKSFHKNNGFSECYSVEDYDLIVSAITNELKGTNV
jgi:hypothetical protein